MRSTASRIVPLLGSFLVALAVVTTPPAADAARAGQARPGPPRVVGVAVPGLPGDFTALDVLTARLGQAPGQVTWYSAWATTPNFPSTGAARIAATGAVPEVTWEPWDPAAGVDQPAYRLDRITAGAYDAYISRWAKQIKAYREPVVIRLAHEMNGSWYPWAERANGNGPGDFVAAWRHIVGVFRAARVSNVTWSWAPNVPYPGSTPLTQLYPGDAYVTRVGLDGYNWSTLQPMSMWQSFAEVFEPGLAELTAITSRPVYVTETATPEVGGDKAAWISDMWSTLAAHPEVRGVTWFDFHKETDWRIDSSDPSLVAFATGMRTLV